MRNSKPGLGDLKRLQKESAIASQRNEAERHDQGLRAAQDLKARQSDALLFARVVQAVQPLGSSGRILHAPRASQNHEDARARIAQRREQAIGETARASAAVSDLAGRPQEPGSDLAFAAPGVGPDTLRRLQQAFWPVGAQLDLHGHTADTARDALARFVEQSRSCATRCVRVIHGVGHGVTAAPLGNPRALVSRHPGAGSSAKPRRSPRTRRALRTPRPPSAGPP